MIHLLQLAIDLTMLVEKLLYFNQSNLSLIADVSNERAAADILLAKLLSRNYANGCLEHQKKAGVNAKKLMATVQKNFGSHQGAGERIGR